MPSPKSHRRGQLEDRNQNRRGGGGGGRLSERSSSFHGESPTAVMLQMRRPKTLPDLLAASGSRSSIGMMTADRPSKLTKLLLNVTIQGSVGAVQVVVSPELTVSDLVTAALRQYAKEGRRPILPTTDPSKFDLHYSQFSLESLDREEKLNSLGSRNFFLCRRKSEAECGSGSGGVQTTPSSSCSKEAGKAVAKSGFAWLKFMDFLL
ncbi:hypothetical protein FNV43_RR05551 [Rhamnella rubrinervis]|uniref:DUF7054 domain-containing protein n=1 Tax=Rhamnella rubrinervis TaxID=2594499 RepID=A0A8K0HN65_9ROSA|nr:hypothetical protein FNV43_RR05551 [Rhamnella rubrinervis]